MRYFLGAREDDQFFTQADAEAMYARYEARLSDNPQPPSFLFEWDELKDFQEMTGLESL